MKVLWFTSTPSLYDQGKHHYHGAGWIESLERLLSAEAEIELAICFYHSTDDDKAKMNDVTYYPSICIQLELSLLSLYEGQSLYRELIEHLSEYGSQLWHVIPGFSDPNSGRMLQVDGVFFKEQG